MSMNQESNQLTTGTRKLGFKRLTTLDLTKIAILSALSFLLSFLEIQIPIFPAFLKFDLADIPAIIAMLSSGPIAGVLVVLIKNLLCLFKSSTLGVGELANFAAGGSYVLVVALFYSKHRTLKSYVTGAVVGSIVMIIVTSLMNYFVLINLYTKLFMSMELIMEMAQKVNSSVTNLELLVILGVAPFNAVKAILISVIGYIVYKFIKPVLKFM